MKKHLICLFFLLLVYTRFVGLDWGLPYPMHPDERNEAVAVQQLHCEISNFKFPISNLRECFNPHFFAYGQFPLYLGFGTVQLSNLLKGKLGQEITFVEATLALRFISAISSVFSALVLIRIIKLFTDKKFQISNFKFQILSVLTIVFSPYFIQFSHFGTTESLLMFFYSLVVYLCLLVFVNRLTITKHILLLSLISGLAVATKISSISFTFLPVLTFFYLGSKSKKYKRTFILTTSYLLLTVLVAILFSPHNFLNWQDFLGSMRYESAVGTGAYKAFYTRQFEHTVPVIFQLAKIFPYALGFSQYILFLIGFIFLPWKDSKINLLRLALLIYFIPASFLYTKWTRFMAPIFPLSTVFALLELIHVKRFARFFTFLAVTMMIVPGIAYLSIYQKPDVRFQASEWIYKHIPENSKILSETANVVDIPLQVPGSRYGAPSYQYTSFNFYDIDHDQLLQQQLAQNIQSANYIFIPSRRLFANNVKEHPFLDSYYQMLFSGRLGFTKVAEFSSFPKIEVLGKVLIEFSDENAEETWTVFDHPKIRIYKRSIL